MERESDIPGTPGTPDADSGAMAAAADAVARLAAGPCPALGDICLLLGQAVAGHDATVGDDRLDDLARNLFGAASDGPEHAAHRLARLFGGGADDGRDPDALQLAVVAERRCGHPLAVAVCLSEAGRRAGLETGVFSSPAGWYAALADADDRWWLIDVSDGGGIASPADIRRHCGHELAFATLVALEHRYATCGRERCAARGRKLRARISYVDAPLFAPDGDPLAILWPDAHRDAQRDGRPDT